MSIAYAQVGLGLGPTNPEWIDLPQEPSGFRCGGFAPPIRYSCRHSHFLPLQPSFQSTFSATGTLPYHMMEVTLHHIRSVGGVLSPVSLSAPDHSTSELLRTLSRMAASKPTSWLSERSDHLSHYSTHLGTLAVGLGCFPLDDESSHPPSHYTFALVAFTVWLGSVSALPPYPSSSLPPRAPRACALTCAEPQSISGRTSYLRVRLAFHPYPQLIRHFCNSGQFAPPVRVTGPSHWPRVAHPVSGLLRAMRTLPSTPSSDSLSLGLLPSTGPHPEHHAQELAGSFFNRHAIRHPSCEGTALSLTVGRWFQDLFHSPRRGTFHLSLTVLVHYRSRDVFSLGAWAPQLPAGFLVSRGTHVPHQPAAHLVLQGLHLLWRRVPTASNQLRSPS